MDYLLAFIAGSKGESKRNVAVSEEDDTLAEYLEAEVLSFDSASSSDSEVSNSLVPFTFRPLFF